MSMWPESLTVGPLREWPGKMTPGLERRASPFSSTLTSTLDLLGREIRMLTDTVEQERTAEMLIAVPAGAFRQDGRPYARAVAEHPGIVFSIESRHGRLSYPSDAFLTWEDNLRAVALSLEALRKVDRYRVAQHGEQYRGYLALEAGGTSDVDAAAATIAAVIRATTSDVLEGTVWSVRYAKRLTHPDTANGERFGNWHDVIEAERVLGEAGLL